jgi:HEAT repeat protein
MIGDAARRFGLAWAGLASHERVLLVLIMTVLALLVLAVLFTLLVLALRVGHVRRRRRRAELEGRWRGPLVEVLAGDRSPETLAAAVRPGEELTFLAFLMTFARRVRGEEAEVLDRVAAPSLPAVERALHGRSPEQRALAVQILATFGPSAYAPRLVAALDDPSPYVAMAAAQSLASREHPEHGEVLVRQLARFNSWSVDYLSAMLGRIGPTIAPAARAVLADPGQPPRTRAVAADALHRLGDPESADLAVEVLSRLAPDVGGADAVLARTALALLAKIGRAEHAAALRRFLRAPDAVVRAEAIGALAAVGLPDDTALLTAALDDGSPLVAGRAAQGLIRVGCADVVERRAAAADAGALVALQALADQAAR